MTTLQNVADDAGVTKMTVSNVLNGRDHKVSPATRKRVLESVKKLRYVPNAAARALTTNQTNLISFIYPRHSALPLSNAHDSIFMGALEASLSEAGYLLNIQAAANVLDTVRRMREWNVAGAIVLGTFHDEVAELSQTHTLPSIFVDNYSTSPLVSTVTVNDEQGGYLAGHHLVELGHHHVAFVGPRPEALGVVAHRLKGFTRALEDAGITLPTERILTAETFFDDGFTAAARICALTPRPTAIFVTADILAAGLIKGLFSQGVHVPEDISVISFDDLPIASQVTPEITTIRQNIQAKAQITTEVLLEQIRIPEAPRQHRQLDTTLVLRQSTAPPAIRE